MQMVEITLRYTEEPQTHTQILSCTQTRSLKSLYPSGPSSRLEKKPATLLPW